MADKAQLSALERLERLEKDFDAIKQNLFAVAQSSELTAQRLLGVEHSAAAMGKMMGAITKQLKAKGLLDDAAVMDQIRADDDEAAKERVESMVKEGFIAPVETVNETSLVIVSHDILDQKTSVTKHMSSYRSIEMPSPGVTQKVKQDLINRKVGDKFETETGDKTQTAIVTVLAIYNLVERQAPGESESAPQSSADATPTADAAPAASAQ
jgi:hypothetical protein